MAIRILIQQNKTIYKTRKNASKNESKVYFVQKTCSEVCFHIFNLVPIKNCLKAFNLSNQKYIYISRMPKMYVWKIKVG